MQSPVSGLAKAFRAGEIRQGRLRRFDETICSIPGREFQLPFSRCCYGAQAVSANASHEISHMRMRYLALSAEPGRANRKSRITCMRMLRTNQSKVTRVMRCCSRQCVVQCNNCAMTFLARAQTKKKHIYFDIDIVVKN